MTVRKGLLAVGVAILLISASIIMASQYATSPRLSTDGVSASFTAEVVDTSTNARVGDAELVTYDWDSPSSKANSAFVQREFKADDQGIIHANLPPGRYTVSFTCDWGCAGLGGVPPADVLVMGGKVTIEPFQSDERWYFPHKLSDYYQLVSENQILARIFRATSTDPT